MTDKEEFELDQIIMEVESEVIGAMSKYPPFNTAHEGCSVLREEFEELWDEVKVKQGKRSLERLHDEAIQVAAMAIRFAYDMRGERGQR